MAGILGGFCGNIFSHGIPLKISNLQCNLSIFIYNFRLRRRCNIHCVKTRGENDILVKHVIDMNIP